MSKVSVVYWSQSGNTQAMAEAVAAGITEAGKEAEVVYVSDVNVADLTAEKAFALGCPAMGAEVLEEGEFEPFMESIDGSISGKTIVPGDKDLLYRALYNVLVNAAQAGGRGAAISVELREEGGRVLVSVADSGPGFDLKQLDSILTPSLPLKTAARALACPLSTASLPATAAPWK